MALIKCWECSIEISDIAESCPHCGAGKAIECHECSKQISKRLNKCPHCGAPRPSIFDTKISKIALYLLSFIFPILSYAFLFESNWEWDFHIYSGLICVFFTILTIVSIYDVNRINKATEVYKKRKRTITIIAIIAITAYYIGSIIFSTRPTLCNCIEQAEMNSSMSDECISILSHEGINFYNKNELQRRKKDNCE